MKYLKLPSLTIQNPFSVTPTVSEHISKLKLVGKTLALIVIFVILIGGGFFLNVQHEQHIQLEQQIQLEKVKATQESGIVLDATADIISREGKLPISVAKKYATWIFEAGAKYQVDPIMILSIMAIESGFKYKVVSSGNGTGLMQVIYSWHKEKTTQAALFDPKNNIHVGTRIIKEYADKSSSDATMLVRYNGGGDPVYAVKVLSRKSKYDDEIMSAVVRSI